MSPVNAVGGWVTRLLHDLQERLMPVNDVGGRFFPPSVQTPQATQVVDLAQAETIRLLLTQNVTLSFINAIAGANYRLLLVQDATGSRTVTWPSTAPAVRFGTNNTPPTLTTTALHGDLVTMYFDGTRFYATAALDFGVV